ncbi:Uncharacterised protein [Moraxella lacunata]|uniref:Uncharacterized protein n=1 Tax=Moraxella lacunata TaxID=477 RepID=A0A378T5Y2_MORLA|nr:hypothetical protein [Moraxella lacunata]STZ56231.1 Uncharacterised protein [Moraxella lacunata]
MNIFYDDLFCKENTEDIVFLQEKGYAIRHNNKIKRMSLNEIYANLFSYLDDYKNAGFKFINFPDELISISNDYHKFQCFGKSNSGYFVINEKEEVYLIVCKYYSSGMSIEDYFDKNNHILLNKYINLAENGIFIIYVNKNLLDFLNSYSYFLSAIYEVKGNFKSYNESLSNISELIANDLQKKLFNIDNHIILEHSYWSGVIYEIRSVNIMLNFQLAPYQLTGRI